MRQSECLLPVMYVSWEGHRDEKTPVFHPTTPFMLTQTMGPSLLRAMCRNGAFYGNHTSTQGAKPFMLSVVVSEWF